MSKVKIATIWWCWPLLVLKAGVSISNLMKNGDPWSKAKTNFQFLTGFRETIQNGDDQTNIIFIHLLSVVLVGTVRGYRVPAVQLVKSENSPGSDPHGGELQPAAAPPSKKLCQDHYHYCLGKHYIAYLSYKSLTWPEIITTAYMRHRWYDGKQIILNKVLRNKSSVKQEPHIIHCTVQEV